MRPSYIANDYHVISTLIDITVEKVEATLETEKIFSRHSTNDGKDVYPFAIVGR